MSLPPITFTRNLKLLLLAIASTLAACTSWGLGCGGEEGDEGAPSAPVVTGTLRQGVVPETTLARASVEALRNQCATVTPVPVDGGAKTGLAGEEAGATNADAASGLMALPFDSGTTRALESLLDASALALGSDLGDAGTDAADAKKGRVSFVTDGVKITPQWEGVDGATLPLEVRLADVASGTFSLRDTEKKIAIHVKMLGGAGALGEVSEDNVVYRGGHSSGGDVIHRVTKTGTEDWVIVKSKGAAPEVVYEVALENVAGIRHIDNGLAFLDPAGVTQLRMFAPDVRGAGCERLVPTVSVEGCATAREGVVAPGASTCKVHVAWDDTAVTYPVIVDPVWGGARTMVQGVEYPAFASVPADVVLADGGVAFAKGDIIVAGGTVRVAGSPYGEPTATTQVYRWAALRWDQLESMPGQATPTMSGERQFHTLNVVGPQKDKLIAVGGTTGQFPVPGGSPGNYAYFDSTPIYDMRTGHWVVPTSRLINVRVSHRTASMWEATSYAGNDGRVVTVGGHAPATNSVEAFVPGSPTVENGAWGVVARLNVTRLHHVAVPLLDGRVLVAGGWSPQTNDYEPSSELVSAMAAPQPWASAPWAIVGPAEAQPQGIAWSAAVREPTWGSPPKANVVLAGGEVGTVRTAVAKVRIYNYDPLGGIGSWTTKASNALLPDLPLPRSSGGLVALGPAGQVFFGGGWASNTMPTNWYRWEYGLWRAGQTSQGWQTDTSLPFVDGHSIPIIGNAWGYGINVAGGSRDNGGGSPAPSNLSEPGDFCPEACNDGNPCTIDRCNAAGACVFTYVGQGSSVCADADQCNGTETCDGAGHCVAGAPPNVVDNNPCTEDICAGGVLNPPTLNGVICDDGNACTLTSTCQAGVCTKLLSAGAGTACKSDGDPCNGSEVCNSTGVCISPGLVVPTPAVTDPCTETVCVANVGFVTRAKTGAAAGCDAGAVAPVTDPTVASDLAALGDVLLSSGRQTGASFPANTTQQRAIISGRVRSDLGDAGLGVPSIGGGDAVSIIGHPEFGSSKLRVDGTFDILVNGGATYRLLISVGQSFPIQRTVAVEWQDWVTLDDVVLVSDALQSPPNTALSMPTTAWQIQRGPAVNEPGHPQRQPFVLFPPNARTVLPDGGVGPAGSLQVTFTEYTVGAAGPKRMPGTLPPATAYTYATSIRALIGGVMQSEVNFDPVARPILYVDDFITTNPNGASAADAGTKMPLGYFDPVGGAWVPSDDPVTLAKDATIGRFVSLVCTPTQSLTGAPVAESPIPAGELSKLCEQFPTASAVAPKRLWRLPLLHFSDWDGNLGFGPDPGAGFPPDKPSNPNKPKPDPDCAPGSIIECENQVLAEEVPVVGTPYSLRYQSDRQLGRQVAIDVPITAETAPGLWPLRVDVIVDVAGRQLRASAVASTLNQSIRILWDRRDRFGREVVGSVPAHIATGYVYAGSNLYRRTDQFGAAATGGAITADRAAREVTLWRHEGVTLHAANAKPLGLGGWNLSAHHQYDPVGRLLNMGDGRRRYLDGIGTGTSSVIQVLKPPAGVSGFAAGAVAVAPDGAVFVGGGQAGIWRYATPTAVPTKVAGNGLAETYASPDPGNCGDAKLIPVHALSMAVAQDGTLYIQSWNGRIRRIGTDGIIETISGRGTTGTSGACSGLCNGVLATDIENQTGNLRAGLSITPDGSILFADATPGGQVLRQITRDPQLFGKGKCGGPGWRQRVVLGGGAAGAPTEGAVATAVGLNALTGFGLAADGSVLFANTAGVNSKVWASTPAGTLRHVAGGCTSGCPTGDGIDAGLAMLQDVRGIEMYRGELLLAERSAPSPTFGYEGRLRRVDRSGRLDSLSAVSGSNLLSDGTPLAWADLLQVEDLTVAPDGAIYAVVVGRNAVVRVQPPVSAVGATLIPAEDGRTVFEFDASGRHVATKDANRGVPLYEFTYVTAAGADKGKLASVIDRVTGQTLAITRPNANTVILTSQFGKTTTLTLAPTGTAGAGYVTSIRHKRTVSPLVEEVTTLTHDDTGLLKTFKRPANTNASSFQYDTAGALISDTDPRGNTTTLVRTEIGAGWETSLRRANGGATVRRTEDVPNGGVLTTTTDLAGVVTTKLTARDGTTTTSGPGGLATTVNAIDGGSRFGLLAPDYTRESTIIKDTGGATLLTRDVTHRFDSGDAGVYAATSTIERTTVEGTVAGTTQPASTWSTTTVYSDAGAVATTTNPVATRRVQTTLDDKLRVTRVQYLDAGLPTADIAYGATFGRVSTVTVTSPTAGEGSRTFTNHYDVASSELPSAATDPSGRRVTFFRDDIGRPTAVRLKATQPDGAVSLPDGSVVDLGFDFNGDLTAVTPPGKPIHLLNLDGGELLGQYVPPDAGFAMRTTSYGYDTQNRLTQIAEPFDVTTRSLLFGYDSAGRGVLEIDTLAGTSVQTTYHPTLGWVTNVDATGASPQPVTLSFTYAGPLLSKVSLFNNYAVGWQYDHRNRVFHRTVEGQGVPVYAVPREFDADGLLTKIALRRYATSVDVAALTYTRDPYGVGLLTSSVNSTPGAPVLGAVTESWQYSGFGEPKRYDASTGATAWLRIAKAGDATGALAFTRDSLGRVTARQDTVVVPGGSGLPASIRWDYVYDDRGRLWKATKDGAGSPTFTYEYDENGNRTKVNGATVGVYDAQDRLASYNGVAYGFTNNGALKTRGANETFTYDLSGGLRQYVNTSPSKTVDYRIDGFGRRVFKSVGGISPVSKLWVYDDQVRIAGEFTWNQSGTYVSVFGYGSKSNVPDLMLQYFTPTVGSPTERLYRIVSDLNGSVRVVLDLSTSTPTVKERIDYDPFGQRTGVYLNPASGYEPVPFGFAGGLYDVDTGLLRFGARDYEPATGRWTTKDPARFGGGANLYGYCYGDPVNFIDPEGDIADILAAGGAAAGGAATGAAQAIPLVGINVMVLGALAYNIEALAREWDSDAFWGEGRFAPKPYEAHKKNARRSTQEDHQNGVARTDRDQGGEKADKNRDPKRQRPPGHKGPWPPKPPVPSPIVPVPRPRPHEGDNAGCD